MKKFIESINLADVSVGTVVRLIMLLITMVVWVCGLCGVELPGVDESTVGNIVIAIFGVVALLQSYWKNNSWTTAAQEADEYMQEKKEEI